MYLTLSKNFLTKFARRLLQLIHPGHILARTAPLSRHAHSMKAAQTLAKPKSQIPVSFDESLVTRCFPHKFRRIGDPYGYLDEIGLEAILEFIYKGNLLIDVAEATNVPLMRLRRWVEDRGFFQQVEDAETQSADGYLARARRAVETAPTEFELRRAKEMMKHAEFMAQNKNKHMYGGGVAKQKNAPVHYEFVIGANAAPETAAAVASAVIDGESKRMAKDGTGDKSPSVSLAELFPHLAALQDPTTAPPAPHLVEQIKPTLVAARPVVPTAENPDVGPFYDDPTDRENTALPAHYMELV